MVGEAPFDDDGMEGAAPVQDFFSSDPVNQDGYTGDGDYWSDINFGGDGENGSVYRCGQSG